MESFVREAIIIFIQKVTLENKRVQVNVSPDLPCVLLVTMACSLP